MAIAGIAQAADIQAPQSRSIHTAESATFQIFVVGPGSDRATVQWFKDGVIIPGATAKSYTTPPQPDSGMFLYAAEVTIGQEITRTPPAVLYVLKDNSEGLVSHWTFDKLLPGNVVSFAPDEVGNFDATIVNGGLAPGIIGADALSLPGNDAYMVVNNPGLRLALVGKAFSLLWWHRQAPNHSMQDVFELPYFHVRVTAVNVGSYVLEPWDIYLPNYANTEVAGSWRHYALVYDGKQARIYEDGISRTAWSSFGIQEIGPGPSLVLGKSTYPEGYFNGLVDDVRVYDRALGLEEIRALGPAPAIEIRHQPRDLRVGMNDSVSFSAEAVTVGTQSDVFYSWELDGQPIQGNGNTVKITAPTQPGIGKVRARITAGTLQASTREAAVETVAPSAPRLLLQYDFENDTADIVRDSMGAFQGSAVNVRKIPGRVGKFGAGFNASHIRTPAAGTDLELVGTPYTIATWIFFQRPLSTSRALQAPATPIPWTEVVFDLGPQTSETGYGSDFIGRNINFLQKDLDPQRIATPLDYPGSASWNHIAVVYDGKERRFYLNGILAARSPAAMGVIGSGKDDLIVGNSSEAVAAGLFDGYLPYYRVALGGGLDDFRIYNYALADGEIARLAAAPTPVSISATVSGLKISWPNSPSGTVQLEQTPSLAPPAQWSVLGVTPTVDLGQNTVLVQASGQTMFFRLRSN